MGERPTLVGDEGSMVFLKGGAVSYERGTPVPALERLLPSEEGT